VDHRGWRSSWIAPARELSGMPTQVVVGLVANQAGELMMAIRIGEDGDTVLLPTQSAVELIANARRAMTEKLRIENGGES
jgi:hypothetical protein